MTNGSITKKILAAGRNEKLTIEQLERKVHDLLMKFPLSSFKMVYDQDIAKFTQERQDAILRACIATDKIKHEGHLSYYSKFGSAHPKFDKSFGRFSF